MSIKRPWLDDIRAVVGQTHVRVDPLERRAYGRDLWPRLQLERLQNLSSDGPDAIIWPACVKEVAELVKICRDHHISIVPYGAGSGVCGGALAAPGSVVIDLKRLKRIRNLDVEQRIVEVEAGFMGERFERTLNTRGLSLGHFPSSILCSTVGGWLAGRSAGQCSSRYGKIEDMVIDLEVVTADGQIRHTNRQIGGPDWTQVFVGSEGTLGIITAARLRLQPLPEHRVFRGWLFPTTKDAIGVMRATMLDGLKPAVVRLYDPLDTKMVGADPHETQGQAGVLKSLLSGSGSGLKHSVMRTILGLPSISNAVVRRWKGPVLMVTMTEGERVDAEETHRQIQAHADSVRGVVDLGEAPGRAWLAHRYDVSYKQSRIYAMGAFVDTFEVATTWDNVMPVYDAVRSAVSPHVVVMAHFSHAYGGGCSIYFTFAGSGKNVERMQQRYDGAWKAGLDAALQQGAAIAHHHGVGLSRMSHMKQAHGEGTRIFAALKATLDPTGIMNPGKVMP